MVKKFILKFLLIFLSFVILITNINITSLDSLKVSAQENDFYFEYDITHTLKNDLTLVSNYKVTVTNKISKNFINKSKIIYPFKPDKVEAYNDKGKLETSIGTDNGNYVISIIHKPTIGLEAKFNFEVNITTSEAIQKKGEILDVNVPGFTESNSVKVKSTILKISRTLPEVKYTSETLKTNETTNNLSIKDGDYEYFMIENADSIIVLLGTKSKYKFKITSVPQKETVYFPNNTTKQKIIISSVSKSPTDTLIDADGNMVLSYTNINDPIEYQGTLEIQTDKYKSNDTFSPKLDNTYWKYDDKLNNIVAKVKSQKTTQLQVKTALDEVGKLVKYSDKASIDRVGTSDILSSGSVVNSLNIVDLSVVILRSADIPVRLVAGFADTQVNRTFNSNSLHYWIEYYNSFLGEWVEADPTMQLISPNDIYYDGVGLSHIQIFKTSSGFNVPNPNAYKIEASLESGEIQTDENIEILSQSKEIQSGKDKFVEISIQNNGNSIVNLIDLQTVINSKTEITLIKKAIFPSQKIVIDGKIKNDNFYLNGQNPVLFTVKTSNNTYSKQININFSKSNEAVIIVFIVVITLLLILLGVYLFAKKKSQNLFIHFQHNPRKKKLKKIFKN